MDPVKRIWCITCKGKVIKGQPYKEQLKQNEPVLYFEEEGRKFSVEFQNRTDHFGSRHGHVANITVISNNRSVRLPGQIANIKI